MSTPNPTGWMPIESAPKDATAVDLLIDGKAMADCYWGYSTNSKGERINDPIWDGWCCDVGKPGPSSWNPYPNLIYSGFKRAEPPHWKRAERTPEDSMSNPTAIDPEHVEAVARAIAEHGLCPSRDGCGGLCRSPVGCQAYDAARAAILAYTKATSMPVKAGGAGD